jgi:hypothetical protein
MALRLGSHDTTFKTELIADRVWRTRSQLELAVVEYLGWFNTDRIHQALGDVPPAEFEALSPRRDKTITPTMIKFGNHLTRSPRSRDSSPAAPGAPPHHAQEPHPRHADHLRPSVLGLRPVRHAGRELLDRLQIPDPWRRNVDVSLALIDDLELHKVQV